MFLDILEQLPNGIKSIPSPKIDNAFIEYGFMANTTLKASWGSGSCENNQCEHIITNTMTYYGRYITELFTDVDIMDGYNKELIDPSTGNLKSEVPDHIGNRMDLSILGKAISDANSDLFQHSNMITPVYNLLCMYYLANSEFKVPYDPDGYAFDDGRIRLQNSVLYGENTIVNTSQGEYYFDVEDQVKLTNLDPPTSNRAREYTEYFQDLCDTLVIALPPYTPITQMNAIATAICGWKSQSPLGIAHSRPKCAQKLCFTGPVEKLDDFEPLKYEKEDIRAAIYSLVTTNRLFTDFKYALGMLLQVLVAPVPRTIESATWLSSPRKIALPRAKCTRGLQSSEILTKEPWARHPTAMYEFHTWFEHDKCVVPASILLVESAYIALAALELPSNSELTSRNFHEKTCVHLHAETPLLNDLLLLKMHTGDSLSLFYPTKCGMTRYVDRGPGAAVTLNITYQSEDEVTSYNVKPDDKDQDWQELVPLPREMIESLPVNERSKYEGWRYPNPKPNPKLIRRTRNGTITVNNMPLVVYPVYTYGNDLSSLFCIPGWHTELQLDSQTSPAQVQLITSAQHYAFLMDFCDMAGWDLTATEILHGPDFLSGRKHTNFTGGSTKRYVLSNWPNAGTTMMAFGEHCLRRRDEPWLSHLSLQGDLSFSVEMRNIQWFMISKQAIDSDEKGMWTETGPSSPFDLYSVKNAQKTMKSMDSAILANIRPYTLQDGILVPPTALITESNLPLATIFERVLRGFPTPKHSFAENLVLKDEKIPGSNLLQQSSFTNSKGSVWVLGTPGTAPSIAGRRERQRYSLSKISERRGNIAGKSSDTSKGAPKEPEIGPRGEPLPKRAGIRPDEVPSNSDISERRQNSAPKRQERVNIGTRDTQFIPTVYGGYGTEQSHSFQCITAMEQLQNWSFEELRQVDYAAKRYFPKVTTPKAEPVPEAVPEHSLKLVLRRKLIKPSSRTTRTKPKPKSNNNVTSASSEAGTATAAPTGHPTPAKPTTVPPAQHQSTPPAQKLNQEACQNAVPVPRQESTPCAQPRPEVKHP